MREDALIHAYARTYTYDHMCIHAYASDEMTRKRSRIMDYEIL